jgi:dipeptidyl aminopeptidase/acylaminoacyl peptidase
MRTLKCLVWTVLLGGCLMAVATAEIERSACEPVERPDFQRYRDRQLATLRGEQTAARDQNLPIREVVDPIRDLGTEADYLARNAPGVRCERIVYESDGLRIRGYLWTPAELPAGKKLPLIVFNRGGTGDDSKLRANTQFGFERFVRAGYAVIGSQYRGNDGSEGVDEVGGSDVRDVLRLTTLARDLPFIDGRNVFAVGYSRGAMMTLAALRDGAGFNAVALVGLPADFRTPAFDRLFARMQGDATAARAQRSAVTFADKIAAPVLLLQGSGDPLVSVATQTLPFVARLQSLRKTYELVLYDGDSHGLIFNGPDRDDRMLAWFARFKR